MVICTSEIEGISKIAGSHFLKTASRDRANYIAVYLEELTEVAISDHLLSPAQSKNLRHHQHRTGG